LVLIITVSCSQAESESSHENQNFEQEQQVLRSGLKIETGINRGVTPNDSLGIMDFLIHATSVFTNDSTIPIHLHLDVS